MTIKQIKEEMKSYKDFYGGDLLLVDDIDSAKTKRDLSTIIDSHRNHMTDMLSDAQNHLDHLKERTGLTWY
jgi:hypothetical protein